MSRNREQFGFDSRDPQLPDMFFGSVISPRPDTTRPPSRPRKSATDLRQYARDEAEKLRGAKPTTGQDIQELRAAPLEHDPNTPPIVTNLHERYGAHADTRPDQVAGAAETAGQAVVASEFELPPDSED